MDEGAVVGIDVGCSPTRRSSSVCRLEWSPTTVSWEIARFRAAEPEREQVIAQLVGDKPIEAAAFDGPIKRGFEIIGRYRTAERILTRRLRPLIGKPGQSNSPVGKLLNQHANACVAHVVRHANIQPARHGVPIDDKALIEAFPTAFLGMMIANPASLTVCRRNRSDTFYKHLVERGVIAALIAHCLPERQLGEDLSAVINHDDRAALVCAISALCVAKGDFIAVGDYNGWIILPPRSFVQPTQWNLLQLNVIDEGTGTLHMEEAVV